MRKLVTLFLILSFIFPVLSFAEDLPNKAVPLKKGDAAAYDGILIPPDRVGELLGAEIERDELKIRIESQARIRDIERDAYEQELKRKNKWYRDPRVNRVAGFIFGVIFSGAAVYGAGQLN